MKHILVPVDLSRNSKEALRYAVHLALREHAMITIVHFYSLLLKAVIHTTKKGHKEKSPEKWMQKRIKKITLKYPELQIDYKIVKGDAAVSMQSLTKSIGADLLIAGCQGDREDSTIYLGSTAGGIMMASRIPVILIPPRFKFSGIQHIAIAAIFSQVKDNLTLEPLIDLIAHFQPDVKLLLFGEAEEDVQNKVSILPLATDIIHFPDDQYSANMTSHLSQNPTDLLVIIKRKRGFLEKTIGPKRTSSTRFHASIPVLVLIGEND